MSTVLRHRLVREYGATPPDRPSSDPPADATAHRIQAEPDWLVAVFGLGRPVSWSRKTKRSMGEVAEGAFTRNGEPLLLDSEVLRLRVENRKSSHVKLLSATLRGRDFLNPDTVVPGDWVMGWIFNNTADRDRVKSALRRGEAANKFMDGLKFWGRAHGIRRQGQTSPDTGHKTSRYSLSAVGFSELDTQFFYDMALASAAAVSGDVVKWMAQIGYRFDDILRGNLEGAGDLRDNAGVLIAAMLDYVLGRGPAAQDGTDGNTAARAATASAGLLDSSLVPQPQFSREAPAAYLVPRGVGAALGRGPGEATKDDRVFGWADVVDSLIGTQRYEPATGFSPAIDAAKSRGRRKLCDSALKGTFLPVNLSFVNQTVWSIVRSYLNPEINEIYTALRCDAEGSVVPTIVARQIPFSTEAAAESADFPLTRHLSRPRWVVDPIMVRQEDLGRSDATRCNLVHVYGAALSFAKNKSETVQMSRNPPLFDQLDIQRSGIRARMGTVACALSDVVSPDQQRLWLAAIADWSFGSHLTLNGTLTCAGVQSPVAEGDVLEHDGYAYEIEAVVHECSVADGSDRAVKTSTTHFELSNGMPVDQAGATADLPVYPGFQNSPVNTSHPEDVAAFQTIGVDIADLTSDTRGAGTSAVGDRTDAAGGGAQIGGSTEPGQGGSPWK